MDWNKGFTAEYYAAIVDSRTWRDIDRFEITGGKISHVESTLRESADIDATDYPEGAEKWIRIWMNTRQGDVSDHVALFTGLAQAPDRKWKGVLREIPLQCYSVLKPAEDMDLPRGWYVLAGTNGAIAVQKLLSVTDAPVSVTGQSPLLDTTIIAEDGESNLSMVDKILTAIDWMIRISGYGEITICPKSTEASVRFDPIDNDIIEPEVSITEDWYSCPNVFRAIQDDMSAVAKDENENSPFSVQKRGREVWMTETGVSLGTNETLGQYAIRRLKEEQAYAFEASYSRAYRPDLVVGDIVDLNYPAQGLVGNYVITSQNINLGYGAPVSEKVKKHG